MIDLLSLMYKGETEIAAFYVDPYARPYDKVAGSWMKVGRGKFSSDYTCISYQFTTLIFAF